MENKIDTNICLKAVMTNVNQQFNMLVNFEDIVVFGGSNLVHIFNKEARKIEGIIQVADTGLVSSLNYLSSHKIVYGTDNGSIGIIDVQRKKIIAHIQGFSDSSIAFVKGVHLACSASDLSLQRSGENKLDDGPILLWAASFGNLKLFRIELNKVDDSSHSELLQEIKFGNNFIETFDVGLIDGRYILFLACCDFNIHIYEFQKAPQNSDYMVYINSISGHENKVKSLAVKETESGLWLASAGLDNYIRLWKTKPATEVLSKHSYKLLKDIIIELESVLLGHTEPVTYVKWNKDVLFSSSMDCSILAWAEVDKIWTNILRLGQVYGNKNAFFGVWPSPKGDDIVAYTYTGALYRWIKSSSPDDSSAENKNEFKWRPKSLFGGHWKAVTDISWGSSGTYLFSCSSDQTTRVVVDEGSYWFEASRAQIHGYDINCINSLPLGDHLCDLLVCGADEKVIRLLEPPTHFINIHNICNSKDNQLHLYFPTPTKEAEVLLSTKPVLYRSHLEGGQEVLGLMTKALKPEKQNFYFDDPEEEGAMADNQATGKSSGYDYLEYTNKNGVNKMKPGFEPPGEDFLASSTLWPELNKLYGHGYEISAMAATKDGKVLTSACKSQSKDHSNLIFWDLQNYKILYTRTLHNYTVLDIRFLDDKLITVSRDRTVGLWSSADGTYQPIFAKQCHNKVIYSVSAGIGETKHYIVTGSRDKFIKLWKIKEDSFEEVGKANVGVVITAVEFISERLIIVGTEQGDLLLYKVGLEPHSITLEQRLPKWMSHGKSVNKIKRNPRSESLLFATCSDDHTVRIYEISPNKI